VTHPKTSFFARGHFCPPLSFTGLFARLNLAGSLLTVDNRQTIIVFPIDLPAGKKNDSNNNSQQKSAVKKISR
jgi:hypothetical protein